MILFNKHSLICLVAYLIFIIVSDTRGDDEYYLYWKTDDPFAGKGNVLMQLAVAESPSKSTVPPVYDIPSESSTSEKTQDIDKGNKTNDRILLTVDEQVGASSDDCHNGVGTGFGWSLTQIEFSVGYYDAIRYDFLSAARFQTVAVPKDAVITTAYLTLTSAFSYTGTQVLTKLSGEDSDDAATFSTEADYDARSRTTAQVDWDITSLWTNNVEYQSPEIKTIIQEIVNRASWASGNDMVIFWEDDGSSGTQCKRRAYSYDGSTTDAPKLHIEYITDVLVSDFSPDDDSTDVPTGKNLIITFNKNVDAETGNIVIKKTTGDDVVETIDVTGGQVTGSGTNTITINPSSYFATSTGYYVEIAATAFDDVTSNSYAGISDKTVWNFTSAANNNPAAVDFSPDDDSTGVPANKNLIITFDKAVDAETGNIVIKTTSGDDTFETIDVTSGQVTGSGTITITINPSSNFAYNTGYYVEIAATAFDDASSNSYAGISDKTVWNFTTGADVDPPVVSDFNPDDNSTAVAADQNLVITFDEVVYTGSASETDINVPSSCQDANMNQAQNYEFYSIWTIPGSGTVELTKLRFYDIGQVSVSESIQMAIYESSGSYDRLSEIVIITGNGTYGWCETSLATPINIELGTTYFIGLCRNSASYRLGYDNGANCEDYPPTTPAVATYYTTSPNGLDATVPTSGSTYTTQKMIIPGIAYTISGDITIKRTSDDAVFETIPADDARVTGAGSTTITINPSGSLTEGIGYYVLIDATGFRDATDNYYAGIDEKTTWNFTTTANPVVSDFSPDDDSTGVPVYKNLVITFSKAVDAETGNIVIKKTSGDDIVETIDVTSGQVTGSGTATITIDPSSSFAYNTGYYVEIAATAFDDASSNSYPGISDKTVWNFTTGGETIELLPLTIKHNIGAGAGDTCLVYTDAWSIIFDEDNGGGIKWLSDESAGHRGNNQLSNNLHYIVAGGNNSYDATGTLTMIDSCSLFCNLRQSFSLGTQSWEVEYTVYGSGRAFVHAETEALSSGYTPSGGIEFRVESDVTDGAYYKENTSAGASNYILHSDTASGRFDILLGLDEDWSDATGFCSETGDYFGYVENDYSLSAGNKQSWDFMIDFAHKEWKDTTGVGKHADDYRGPDSLEFLQGTYRMERSWVDELVGHWPLDENSSGSADSDSAYDYSGSGNRHNGFIKGGSWTDGKWNGGLIFDGNDSVTYSGSYISDFTASVFSVMMWIKPTSTIDANSVLFKKYSTDNKGIKLAGDGSGNLALTLDGSTISANSGPGTDTVHVAATYHIHSGRTKMYINGACVKYQVNQYPVTSNSANIVIGNGFSGVVDDVRFYKTEISEETIKAISNNGFRSNAGMYMLRSSNNNTIHFKIDGSATQPHYFPIFQISNYWATDKPTAVYYNDSWLTENTHYYAKLKDSENMLYIGFNKTVNSSDLRIYIDDNDQNGAFMVDPMPTMTYGVSGSDYYVQNTSSTTFGAAGSNEFYLFWEMSNASTSMGGEILAFKSSNIDGGEPISSANNLCPPNTGLETFGYYQPQTGGVDDFSSSAKHVTATPAYTVVEASGTRVRLRINERTVDGPNVDYDINTIWTIYPTGQIFRYDSVDNMDNYIDYNGFGLSQEYEGTSNYTVSADYRGGNYGGTTIHDNAIALLSSRDNSEVKSLFTGYNPTVGLRESSGDDYEGIIFVGSDNLTAANAPYLHAFYFDIRHNDMGTAYIDSVCEAVQDIEALTMETEGGTQLTNTEGDINGDGFNEAEGAYIIQADNNSVNFTLQAEAGTDDCRFNPAFRITNYFAASKPQYVHLYNASDTLRLIEGYGYNCYLNASSDYFVIQLDTVLCADTKIYISCDDDLAVTMSDFYAKSGDGKDTLYWRTESEKDNLGFFIYRRINPAFIDSLAQAVDSARADSELHPAGRMFKDNTICYADTAWVSITPTMVPGVEGGTSVGPRNYRKIDYGVENHILYEYKLEAISYDKTRDIYGPVTVKPLPILPRRFFLFHNFPNPVIRYTNIRFDLPKETKVSLYIYNLQGRLIARVIRPDRKWKPGFYKVRWNCTDDIGRKIAAGPYIYRLQAGKKYAKSRLMIVVK